MDIHLMAKLGWLCMLAAGILSLFKLYKTALGVACVALTFFAVGLAMD